MSGDLWDCHTWGDEVREDEVLLASSGKRIDV